jgi:hypothetical protein
MKAGKGMEKDNQGRVVWIDPDFEIPEGTAIGGHSACCECGKDMPICWDVVCFECNRTFCHDCSTSWLSRWYCYECRWQGVLKWIRRERK